MDCDEAKERAVFFRAALRVLVDAVETRDPVGMFEAGLSGKTLLEKYPFDPEAMTILRKMARPANVDDAYKKVLGEDPSDLWDDMKPVPPEDIAGAIASEGEGEPAEGDS